MTNLVLERDAATGVFFRPGRGEEGVIKEQPATYKLLQIEGKVILDIGAHIGCFVNYAYQRRSAAIISVEPEPSSFEILELNAAGRNATLINAAVVHDPEPGFKIPFYLYKTYSAMNSMQNKKGRTEIWVETIGLTHLLDTYQPDTIKMDCEGGEYGVMEELANLPSYVKSIAIELHYNNNPEMLPKSKAIIQGLADQGFQVLKEPRVDHAHWAHHFAVMGVWSRP